MYLYQVGWGGYEGHEVIILEHTKEFYKREFVHMIRESILEVLLNRDPFFMEIEGKYLETDIGMARDRLKEERKNKKDNKNKVTQEDINKYLENFARKFYTNFSEIIYEVIEMLVKKYEFKRVNYVCSFFSNEFFPLTKINFNFEKKTKFHFSEDDKLLEGLAEEYWKRRKNAER